jgi:hypothetical protein
MAIDLVPYLKANGFLRIDHPPHLWQVDVDDVEVALAYTRSDGATGSVTMFLPTAR